MDCEREKEDISNNKQLLITGENHVIHNEFIDRSFMKVGQKECNGIDFNGSNNDGNNNDNNSEDKQILVWSQN